MYKGPLMGAIRHNGYDVQFAPLIIMSFEQFTNILLWGIFCRRGKFQDKKCDFVKNFKSKFIFLMCFVGISDSIHGGYVKEFIKFLWI